MDNIKKVEIGYLVVFFGKITAAVVQVYYEKIQSMYQTINGISK